MRRLVAAVSSLGYEEPTDIQREAIPPLIAGKDVLGQAATGTGKTAGKFALPASPPHWRVGRRPSRVVRGLILGPDPRAGDAGCRSRAPIWQAAGGSLRASDLRRGSRCSSNCARSSVASTSSSLHQVARSITFVVARSRSTPCRCVVLDEADEMLDIAIRN